MLRLKMKGLYLKVKDDFLVFVNEVLGLTDNNGNQLLDNNDNPLLP